MGELMYCVGNVAGSIYSEWYLSIRTPLNQTHLQKRGPFSNPKEFICVLNNPGNEDTSLFRTLYSLSPSLPPSVLFFISILAHVGVTHKREQKRERV